MPTLDIDINFNVDTGELEVAKVSLQELTSSAEEVSSATDSIDSSNIDELGSSSEEASSSADNLSNSLGNQDTSGLDSASSSADSLGSSLDGAKQSSDDLSNSMGILEGGMLMTIGEQIQGISRQSEDMAQQMDNASITVGQLSTVTGMAEPQMVSLINHISNATFPNNEAMMYVKNLAQMGVETQNFGKSAMEIDWINDAFGMGAQRTNQLATELSVLGVDMNNVSSSYNALAYANANTKGGMENFFTFLRKYDADLNQLGYDVDQSAVIIAAATQKYGGGRAALTGLSEALKEADGDSRKLEQALGLQAGALDNASEITGQYDGQLMKLADEESQHKTLTQQLGAAWEDVSLSLSGVLSPMMGFVGLLGQVGSFGMTIKGLREIMTTMGGLRTAIDMIRNSESIWIGVKTVLAGVMGIETASEEANAVAKETNAVATATETAANEMSLGAKISQTAANWALAISESAVLLPLLLIVGAVLAVVAVLWYLYNNNETVRNSIDGLRQGLMNLVGQFVSFVNGIWNSLVGLWNYLVNWFNQLQTMTPQQILLLIANVLVSLNPFASLINSVLSRILPVFIRNASSWITGTVSRARTLVNNVVSAVSNLPNRISSAISGVVNAFTSPFRQAWNYISPIINQIQSGIDLIGSVIPSFGFDGNVSDFGVSDFGFDNSLNSTISSASSSGGLGNTTINNNNTFNGIIEEEASQYIVNSIASYTRKQNLIRGR